MIQANARFFKEGFPPEASRMVSKIKLRSPPKIGLQFSKSRLSSFEASNSKTFNWSNSVLALYKLIRIKCSSLIIEFKIKKRPKQSLVSLTIFTEKLSIL